MGNDISVEPFAVAAPLFAQAGASDDLLTDELAMSDADLTSSRGGVGVGDVQISNATTNGGVADVDASNSITGSITGTTLTDVSGTNVVMVNSGNGVVMQSITEINIILNN